MAYSKQSINSPLSTYEKAKILTFSNIISNGIMRIQKNFGQVSGKNGYGNFFNIWSGYGDFIINKIIDDEVFYNVLVVVDKIFKKHLNIKDPFDKIRTRIAYTTISRCISITIMYPYYAFNNKNFVNVVIKPAPTAFIAFRRMFSNFHKALIHEIYNQIAYIIISDSVQKDKLKVFSKLEEKLDKMFKNYSLASSESWKIKIVKYFTSLATYLGAVALILPTMGLGDKTLMEFCKFYFVTVINATNTNYLSFLINSAWRKSLLHRQILNYIWPDYYYKSNV